MSDVLLLLSVEQLIHHKHEESTGKDFALLQSSVCLESCSDIRFWFELFPVRTCSAESLWSASTLPESLRANKLYWGRHRGLCFFNINIDDNSLHTVPYANLLHTDKIKNQFCARLLWSQSKLSWRMFSGSFNVRLYFFHYPIVPKFEWNAEKRNSYAIHRVRPALVFVQ